MDAWCSFSAVIPALDAAYREYMGQGEQATPEETFRISPFFLSKNNGEKQTF